MDVRLRFAAGLLLLAAACPAAGGVTQVLVSFDTEDFTSPGDATAIAEIADLCSEEGVPATFETVGLLAQQLEAWGRADVVAAMRRHHIGTHTYRHSIHPDIMELAEGEDYAAAYRRVYDEEAKSVAIVKRVLGVDRIWSSAPPGNAEPYVAGRVYADLGIQVDLGASYLARRGGDAWFGGQLRIPYALCMDFFFDEKGAWEPGKLLDRLATGTRIAIYTHPNRVRSLRFWDDINYHGTNSCGWGEWKLSPQRTAACVARGYARMREFFRLLKADPRFRIVSVEDICSAIKPRVAIRRSDVPALRRALEAKLGPIREPANWCVADVFCAAVAFLRGEDEFLPTNGFGFLYDPEAVAEPTTVTRADLVAAARTMDVRAFLPAAVKVGSRTVGPADFLFAALATLETGAESVRIVPREQLGAFDHWPRLGKIRYAGTWMHTPAFKDEWISKRMRLQLWTLRFE